MKPVDPNRPIIDQINEAKARHKSAAVDVARKPDELTVKQIARIVRLMLKGCK